jgi:hypothetical protein
MFPEDEYEELILINANRRDRDSPYPFLTFNPTDGTVVIADDYETSNDDTSRDFVLDKHDAVKFAAALLDYALHGTTSTAKCVSRQMCLSKIDWENNET